METLNPLYTNGFFFLVWYNKLGIVHCTYHGCQVIIFKNYCILLSENLLYLYKQYRPWWNAALCCISPGSSLFCVCTNSVEPDEMQQLYAAFHLGLHCVLQYSFRGFTNTKGIDFNDYCNGRSRQPIHLNYRYIPKGLIFLIPVNESQI